MTLVERFIEINTWHASRKTALLSGFALVTQIIASLIAHITLVPTHIVNMPVFDGVCAAGIAIIAMCWIVSAMAARAGKEAAWSAYLLMIFYGGWINVYVYAMGAWSSPVFSWYPFAVILMTVYFGRNAGWFAFCLVLVGLILSYGISQSGLIPYAPALLDKSVDAQQSAGWVLGIVASTVLTPFVVSFGLCLLVVAAFRLQDSRLQGAYASLARSGRLIRRYVPSQLVEKIIKGEHLESFKPERTKLTIFFSDIEGFTDASDQLDAEDLSAVLNEYLSEMSVIAERYGATINQFVGDGIMIFFGAPQFTTEKDHALRAVRMALDMQKRLLELKDVWEQRGIRKPFRARIGMNTGHASVGDYGSEGRKVYSAIGVQTNIAARIQSHCEPGKVLISDTTWVLVREEFVCTDKGELQLRGVHYPVRVYEVQAF